MICKQCNAQIPDGEKVCGVCGWEIEEQEALVTEEIQEPEAVETAEVAEEKTEQIQQAPEEPAQDSEIPEVAEPVQEQPVQTAVLVEEPAVVSETVEDIKVPEEKVKGKKGKIFLRGFLSVLCCIMIFVLATAMISVFAVRDSLKQENIDQILDKTDIGKIIAMEEHEEMLGSFTAEEVENLYYDTRIGEYIDNTIYDYADYLRGGDVPKGISADEILNIMSEDAFEIEKALGRYPEASEYDAIQEYIGENGKENLGFLSEDVRTNNLLKTIRACLSIYTVIGLGVLILLFVFLMLKARKFRLDTLCWTAVPLILSAVTVAVFGLIKPIALGFVKNLGAVATVGTEIAMDGISGAVLLDSASTLGFGVLLIVIYAVANAIIKAVKKKKQA